MIKKQYNYTVCLSPKSNRCTCNIYSRTKGCLVIKSWDAFRNTVKQLFIDMWKDLLITMCLTAALTTQLVQRNLQNVMKETLYVQCTPGEFPLGPLLQKDLELRLVFPPQLLCGLYAEYLMEHGYRYLQSHRKGMLTRKDAYKRLKFARQMKRFLPSFWKRCISFYFDGTSFVHKANPYAKPEQWNHSDGEQGMKG